MNKKINSKEDESANIIQSLGDIVIKSLLNNENAIAIRGIDKLIDIAITFLDLKSKNEEKFKIEGKILFFKTPPKNQYVSYVTNELSRIFSIAIKNQNSDVSRYIIFNSFKILDKVLSAPNNWQIFEQLVETRNVLGSFYSKLMSDTLDNGTEIEKNLLLHHLIDIPQFTIVEWKYIANYVDAFITYHIYRINKLIIDKDNYNTFKAEIDGWSKTLQFDEPSSITEDISADLYLHNFWLMDQELNKKCDELQFMITHTCLKDLSKIEVFHKELNTYRKMILEKTNDEEKTKLINEKFLQLEKETNELFISAKLYGTFFRIAAYLIFKGKGYEKYLKELWYHTKPDNTTTIHLNRTPVSDSLDWLTLYTIYRGSGSLFTDELDFFEDFQDSESYYYQYYALMLLKTCKTFQFPSEERIIQWANKDKQYALNYFYELASILPVDKLIMELENILKLPEFLSIVKLSSELTIEKKIEQTRTNLSHLKNSQQKIINLIALHAKISLQRIDELKQEIINEYQKDSESDKIATVEYDENFIEYKLLETSMSIKRDNIIEQSFASRFLIHPPQSELANLEIHAIFYAIQSGIRPIMQNTDNYVDQMKAAINTIKSKGYSPNVVFLPLNIETSLVGTEYLIFQPHRILRIDGTDLYIINSWEKFDFTDIIILDSKGLILKYKAKNKSDRVSIEVSGTERGSALVRFDCKICLSVKISDNNAFVRIINENIKPLSADKTSD